jgi:hypothetical protein
MNQLNATDRQFVIETLKLLEGLKKRLQALLLLVK